MNIWIEVLYHLFHLKLYQSVQYNKQFKCSVAGCRAKYQKRTGVIRKHGITYCQFGAAITHKCKNSKWRIYRAYDNTKQNSAEYILTIIKCSKDAWDLMDKKLKQHINNSVIESEENEEVKDSELPNDCC